MYQYRLTTDWKPFYQRPFFWWKVYFIVLSIFYYPFFISSILAIKQWLPIDYFYVFGINMCLSSLYVYAFEQKEMSSHIFKFVFLISLILFNIYVIYTLAAVLPNSSNLLPPSYLLTDHGDINNLTYVLIKTIETTYPLLVVSKVTNVLQLFGLPIFYALFRLGWSQDQSEITEKRVVNFSA